MHISNSKTTGVILAVMTVGVVLVVALSVSVGKDLAFTSLFSIF